jgi:hypothetical protein
MERSFFSALLGTIIRSLLGITTLGGLAFVGSAPGPSAIASPPRSEGGWRLLDPITYENISIFPVVAASEQDTSAFLTLDEGLSSGEVIVSEQGAAGLARTRDPQRRPAPDYNSGPAVNQLVLVNRSKRPLLLLAGELVSGGKQDRIIAKDRIVAPGTEPLPLDVFCVEHGRWSSGSQFAASKTIVHPSVREQAALKQDQNDVWNAVRAGSTASMQASSGPQPVAAPRVSSGMIADTIASAAPTQSYAKIYEGSRVGASVEEFAAQLQKRFAKATSGLKGERAVGVVVAYGGEVAWSDIFASGDLFEHYWPKLLRSYAVEAVARPSLRETASIDDARGFLRRLNGREIQETEAGVYRWRETSEGRLALIELEALQPKPMNLHRLLLQRTT